MKRWRSVERIDVAEEIALLFGSGLDNDGSAHCSIHPSTCRALQSRAPVSWTVSGRKLRSTWDALPGYLQTFAFLMSGVQVISRDRVSGFHLDDRQNITPFGPSAMMVCLTLPVRGRIRLSMAFLFRPAFAGGVVCFSTTDFIQRSGSAFDVSSVEVNANRISALNLAADCTHKFREFPVLGGVKIAGGANDIHLRHPFQ